MIEFIPNTLRNKNVTKLSNRFKILAGKKHEIYKINGSQANNKNCEKIVLQDDSKDDLKILNTNRHTKRDGFVRHSNSVFNIAVSKPLHVHIIHILKFIKLA